MSLLAQDELAALEAIVEHAEHAHGASRLTLAHVLAAYEHVLPKRGIDTLEDTTIHEALLQLARATGQDWRQKLDKLHAALRRDGEPVHIATALRSIVNASTSPVASSLLHRRAAQPARDDAVAVVDTMASMRILGATRSSVGPRAVLSPLATTLVSAPPGSTRQTTLASAGSNLPSTQPSPRRSVLPGSHVSLRQSSMASSAPGSSVDLGFRTDADAAYDAYRRTSVAFRGWVGIVAEVRKARREYDYAVARWRTAVWFCERQLCERSFRGFVRLLARKRKLIDKALTLHPRALERRVLTEWRLVVVYGLRMRKLVLARALRRFARRMGYQGKVRTELDALKVLVYRWQLQAVLLAWNWWHAIATSRAKLRRAARHLVSRHSGALRRALFAAWRQHADSMGRLRENAISQLIVRRRRFALAALATGCSISRQQREHVVAMLNRSLHRDKALAVMRWLSHAAALASTRASLALCVRMWRQNRRQRSLATWLRHTRMTTEALGLLGSVITALRYRSLRRAVNTMLEAARERAKMLHVLSLLRSSLLTTAWSRWRHQSTAHTAWEERVYKVLVSIGDRMLGTAWRTWRAAAAARSTAFEAAIARLTNFDAWSGFRLWCVYVVERRASLIAARQAVQRWMGSLAATCLHAWTRYAALRVEKRRRNQVASSKRTELLTHTHLTAWREVFDRQLCLQAIGRRVGAALVHRALRTSINTWLAVATFRALARRVVSHSRLPSQASAFRIWVVHAHEQREFDRRLRLVLRTLRSPRLARSLRSWGAWCRADATQMELVARGASLFLIPTALCILRFWHKRTQLRISTTLLLSQVMGSLLQNVFFAWARVGRRHANARAVKSILDAHRRQELGRLALRAWALRSAVSPAAAAGIRAWLLRSCVSLPFDAWARLTQKRVLACMDSVAAYFFSCEEKRRAFVRWHVRFQKERANGLALAHWAGKLEAAIVTAWRVVTKTRKAKRAISSVVRRNSSRLGMRHGLNALARSRSGEHAKDGRSTALRRFLLKRRLGAWCAWAREHYDRNYKAACQYYLAALRPRLQQWATAARATLTAKVIASSHSVAVAQQHAFATWKQRAGWLRGRRQRATEGFYRWASAHERRALKQWLDVTLQQMRAQHQLRCTLQRWTSLRARVAVEHWSGLVTNRREALGRLDATVRRWGNLSMRSNFDHWLYITQESHRLIGWMRGAVARWATLTTKVAIVRWLELAGERQRKHGLVRSAAHLLGIRLMRMCFRGMENFLVMRRRVRTVASEAASRIANREKLLVWRGWHDFILERRAAYKRAGYLCMQALRRDESRAFGRLVLYRRANMLRLRYAYLSARRQWLERQEQLQQWRLLARASRALLRRIFAAWSVHHAAALAYRAELLRAHANQIALEGHLRKKSAGMLHDALMAMRRRSAERHRLLHIFAMLGHKHQYRVATKVLAAWRREVTRSIGARLLLVRVGTDRCSECIARWRLRAATGTLRARQLDGSRFFYAQRLKREVLAQWRALVLSRVYMREADDITGLLRLREDELDVGSGDAVMDSSAASAAAVALGARLLRPSTHSNATAFDTPPHAVPDAKSLLRFSFSEYERFEKRSRGSFLSVVAPIVSGLAPS